MSNVTDEKPKQDPTPQERMALRTGRCVSIGCKADCQAFVLFGKMDGFPTCGCGHTQWGHAIPGSEKS